MRSTVPRRLTNSRTDVFGSWAAVGVRRRHAASSTGPVFRRTPDNPESNVEGDRNVRTFVITVIE